MPIASNSNWSTYGSNNHPTDFSSTWLANVAGSAASGLDLVVSTTWRLYQAKADTARDYALQSEALPQSTLRAQNRRALALMEAWYAEADDLGEAWWAEFERELKQNRVAFRTF